MKRILNIAGLACNTVILIMILAVTVSLSFSSGSSVGIIGGTDGPTAVYWSLTWWLLIPVTVFSFYEIVFIFNLRKRT